MIRRALLFSCMHLGEKMDVLQKFQTICFRTALRYYVPGRRGGPMCPPGGNTLRLHPTFGEFKIPTIGGSICLSLRP